ncbi:MAG: prolipoprotein diacylglyceryl transferase family protein, partial [Candidatus Izemoplasmataceae bacterium]
GLTVLLVLRRTKYLRSGDLIGIYLIWYGIGRFFVEILRTDALLIWNSTIRIAQVISIISIILGIVILLVNRYLHRPLYNERY